MLHYRADLRTLAYIVFTTILFAALWVYGFNWIAYSVYLLCAIAVSVITHNHQHLKIWKNRTLNTLTDWWLTAFYGLPIFVWIPTHNRNHHKFTNKEGDVSITYRHTEENNFLSVLSYPSVSGYHQMKESIIPYMVKLRQTDRQAYIENCIQIVVLAVWVIGFLLLDWKKALIYVVIPQQFSAFIVMVFNYIQHVHTDEESPYDHSRNFMGINWLLFNNGYHTAHHERAGIHWSLLPAEHNRIAHLIKPELVQKTMLGYLFRTYILGAFDSRFMTFNMRQARLKRQE